MVKFFKLLLYILLGLVILAYGLEWLYTHSYKHPVNPRNKVSWLNKLEQKKYDYALFGSSRCLNTVNPKQIDKATGLSGINMAYNGSNSFEIKLMVKQFVDKFKPKEIFVQVDDRFDRERNDPTSSIFWIPFIDNEYIYSEFMKRDSLAWYYRNIPFYKYLLYESKIGLRDVSLSYIKNNSFENLNGFVPTNGSLEGFDHKIKQLPDRQNIHLSEIIDICEKENIKLYFFTAPYFEFDLNTEVIKKHLPNYKDFSTVIDEKQMFHDQGHLNAKGAKEFTKIFIEEYF
ncbi:hypothetical protein [Mesonia sp.]|uniref:hypothetical protein n=1 Tax=Mesonia sp. TaxID=1960830 RepID=UPI001771AA4E|nr:hypothetical protein [Mesonia sp.]HIB35958.1 hypothetical protein [Mesonia sp.]